VRLARFRYQGSDHTGVVVADEVADLGPDAGDHDRVARLLSGGSVALDAARAAADAAPRIPLTAVDLLAPVPRPGKLLAIGLNYADHVSEGGGRTAPEFPLFFNKQTTCVTGPGAPIHIPAASSDVDYEGELGVVIGRRCRHVPVERAAEVIGGYLVVNDVSVRDWQFRSPTLTLGKSWDTHGPTGPWVVTADELPEPHGLRLTTIVSGELMQDATTDQMIHDVWHQVALLSTVCTLEPGDLVSTGTPSGVGAFRDPPRYLVPGDTVRIEIEGIGVLENPVIAEPAGTAER
jgi:2-keto-4-pentenoate hydratase/2-oxohepta-3-ene-1,7-dioic acid hydratase in catechol pathway